MAKIDLNLNVQGLGDLREANEEVEELEKTVKSLKHQLEQAKSDKFKSDIDGIAKAVGKLSEGFNKLSKNFKTSSTTQVNAIKKITEATIQLQKQNDRTGTSAKAMVEEYRAAARLVNQLQGQGKISERQDTLISRQLKRFGLGEIDTRQFQENVRKISKVYSNELNKRLDIGSMSKNQLTYEKNMAEIDAKWIEKKLTGEAKALAIKKEAEQKEEQSRKIGEQKLAQEKEVTAQKEKQTKEMSKQQEFRTRSDEAKALKSESQKRVAESRERAYEEQAWAAEIQRQQKLEKNDRARLILREQMRAIAEGEYELEDKQAQKLALATSRLMDTARNIRNFAATQGYKGTVGAEATSMLRSSQFYKQIMDYAVGWKRVNSEEGKAADTLGRMLVDAKNMQSGINRIHTAFGQLASTVSAIRQIGVEFRKGFTAIAQPLLNIITRVSSSAFKSSLEALKNMELSEIGFSNFFGASQVPGIMQNIKQEALLSPMSAAQLASYVNQIAPLAGGNSQLAINAATGVAKMIQYSGGEVTTEMEYVVKNLRDVIAKGTATTIDIRQFNRAMPAFKKVLQEMGLEDFLKDGEIHISKETAPKLLEAFQKINEFGDVATIFERTSETISGLMERIEEQVQFLIIDVGEFSGLTDLIKHTMHDFLEDSNGLLSHIKTQAQFIGRDVTNWLKTRDWERVLDIAKEVFSVLWNGLKDSLGILRQALGGTDWKDTLINLANLISSFVKGIANSYSWLLGIMNTLNKSGILGSGLVQGGMGILGFLSGNAGTLITGGLRGFGNFMGTLNQVTFSLISSMERQQAELLKSATTVNTFDEALMIVSQSLSNVAKDILLVDEAIGGVLTAEQRKMVQDQLEANQTEMNTLQTQANTVSKKASQLATQAETNARNLNTQAISANTSATRASSGGGLLGPAAIGGGTKLGSLLSGALRSLLVGTLVGSISSAVTEGIANAVGSSKYEAANAGNWVGSVGGFTAGGAVAGAAIGAAGGPIGALGGAVIGGLAGILKAVLEQNGILDQQRIDELDEFKQTVNNGTYVRELLSTIEGGNNLTTDQINTINSNLVKQMNQWSESTPRGTAQMLKDYLTHININGHDLTTEVKKITDDLKENANLLWRYVEADEIEKGNDFAATLKQMGYSSYEISAMIYGKAAEAGKTPEEIRDYLLKWGSTQDGGGNDLNWDAVSSLNADDKAALQKKLWNAWFEIGKEGAANMAGDNAQKEEFAQEFADTMSKFLVGAVEQIDEEKILSLVDWSDYADKAGNVKSIWEALGIGLSSEGALSLFNKKDDDEGNAEFKALVEKYGLSSDNLALLNNTITETVADHQDISNIVQKMTAGQTRQEILDFQKLNYMKYEKSTSDFLRDSIYPKLLDIEAATKAAATGRDTTNTSPSTKEDSVNFWGMKLKLPQTGTVSGYNGGILYRAAGGGVRGVDTIPAMLQRGEYVVRRSAVEKVGLTALNALNTGNLGYFARALGRQNIYGDYNGARTWNSTANDNRNYRNNRVVVNNYTRGARLNRYYSLANRLI